jgi:antitoxin PrlF
MVPSNDTGRDPIVSAYLAFLERDMTAHPEQIEPMTEEEIGRMRRLKEGVEEGDHDVIPDDVTI